MNRDEAINYLITHCATWPSDPAQAAAIAPPGLGSGWWWQKMETTSGEMALADAHEYLLREDWSNARRDALNRPEEWPRAAEILVQTEEGIWIFGTFPDAQPNEGGWAGNDIGTWLNEGAVKGRADLAGWDWQCSLVHREDHALEDLEAQVMRDEDQEPDALPPGYALTHLVTEYGKFWRAYSHARNWTSGPHSSIEGASKEAWHHDFDVTHAQPSEEEEEVMRQAEARAWEQRLGMDMFGVEFDCPTQDGALETPDGEVDGLLDAATRALRARSHYNRTLMVEISAEDRDRGYVLVKLDPYRLCALYETGGGPREQMAKKALRGTSKGQTERELLDDMRAILDRWDEMLEEPIYSI